MSREYKIRTKNKNVFLRVKKGHFATMHCHTNYYIDVTTQKTRLSEAEAVAKEMVAAYRASTIVDTIICLDGTEVIGASIARELPSTGPTRNSPFRRSSCCRPKRKINTASTVRC